MAGAKHGKRYEGAVALLEADREYAPSDAISLVKQMAAAKFDETVELHLRTNADPRHADQQVRGVAVLPHGLGRAVRVLVFAQADAARDALGAGAEHVGDDDLVQRIEGGWIEFDVAIATPDMMGKIGRLGRLLGRRGLMPNPRTGTVVQPQDVGNAVAEAKKGRVEFRIDRTAIIHSPIGKGQLRRTEAGGEPGGSGGRDQPAKAHWHQRTAGEDGLPDLHHGPQHSVGACQHHGPAGRLALRQFS